MAYYVIRCSEDGEVSIVAMERAEILDALNSGEIEADSASTPTGAIYDLGAGEYPLIIIEGRVTLPKAVARVKEWELP